jgi:hypothetical protein
MFERVRARKTEKGVAVFMRAYGIRFGGVDIRMPMPAPAPVPVRGPDLPDPQDTSETSETPGPKLVPE